MKLRVVQEVYFEHRRRQPGEIVEVKRTDFLNDFGEFEVPRWAVLYEAKSCPGINTCREAGSFGFAPVQVRRPAPESQVEELEFE